MFVLNDPPHRLLHLGIQTWVTPAWGFQFFIKSEFSHINRKIEQAILEADKIGTKVIGLGALNKNEALNGGGALFIKNHPDLKMRLVHGNTLTAAAIIKTIPQGVTKAFVLGATSKLGRGISLYLAKRSRPHLNIWIDHIYMCIDVYTYRCIYI